MTEQILFQATDMRALEWERVREVVAARGVACIRGLFDRDDLRETLAGLRHNFDAARDERHDPRDTEAVRRNFQKLQIGANSGVGSRRTLGRFMRVFYNPIFAADVLGMRRHFVALAQIRNLLLDLPSGFAVERADDDGYWTCARIQQYPAGGGFMVPHRDMYAQVATEEKGLPYYQVLLQLTEKGTDFDEGGAYVDVGDIRFEYESGCRTGDVVVYDGRSLHGVGDIDPMKPLDLARFSGRAVALASLFRVLRSGSDEYGRMAEKAQALYGTGGEPR